MKYNKEAWIEKYRISEIVDARLKQLLFEANRQRNTLHDMYMRLEKDDKLGSILMGGIMILNGRIEKLIEEIEEDL